MSIQERQNLPESLEKLAAQRLLYHRAKVVRNFGMLLVLFIAIIALVGAFVQNKDFGYGVTLSVLFTWLIDQFVLKEIETKYKREAATIQEDFDCLVLDIPWPRHKREKRPTRDCVKQLATLAHKNSDIVKNLKDWYSLKGLPEDEAQTKVRCQRMNCWWDINLRKRWQTVLAVSFWAFVAVAIVVSIFTGITVAKFLALVVSALRMLIWGIAELKNQGAAINNIQGIHQMLDEVETEAGITPAQIRSFQDEIFEHRRTNPPIPDWFFLLHRDRQELENANP